MLRHFCKKKFVLTPSGSRWIIIIISVIVVIIIMFLLIMMFTIIIIITIVTMFIMFIISSIIISIIIIMMSCMIISRFSLSIRPGSPRTYAHGALSSSGCLGRGAPLLSDPTLGGTLNALKFQGAQRDSLSELFL